MREHGWSISAIARHLERDRKTARAYANGDRGPGVRAATTADALGPFTDYLGQRFADDPHVWATVLFDEVGDLGFDRSYQSFTRLPRARGLRPALGSVLGGDGTGHGGDGAPAGRRDSGGLAGDAGVAVGRPAHVLVGSLPFSGRFRPVPGGPLRR